MKTRLASYLMYIKILHSLLCIGRHCTWAGLVSAVPVCCPCLTRWQSAWQYLVLKLNLTNLSLVFFIKNYCMQLKMVVIYYLDVLLVVFYAVVINLQTQVCRQNGWLTLFFFFSLPFFQQKYHTFARHFILSYSNHWLIYFDALLKC